MSASSRSTIFSIRSKKSKDSGELQTHAGPAYEELPMSPHPPISVPTIIPPSHHNGRVDYTLAKLYGGVRDYEDGDESSDGYSIQSEPRNGYSNKAGSISSGLNGPRPLPSRNGSAERTHESGRHTALGHHESPNV